MCTGRARPPVFSGRRCRTSRIVSPCVAGRPPRFPLAEATSFSRRQHRSFERTPPAKPGSRPSPDRAAPQYRDLVISRRVPHSVRRSPLGSFASVVRIIAQRIVPFAIGRAGGPSAPTPRPAFAAAVASSPSIAPRLLAGLRASVAIPGAVTDAIRSVLI